MKNGLVRLLLCALVLEESLFCLARLTCPMITIKNGRVRRRRERARFVTFTCNVGYSLAGEKHSTCIRGKWDPAPPKCIRASCMSTVSPPSNGYIYPSHGGAALHFFCKSAYELRGPQHVYCDGMKWDDNAPICLAVATKPKLSCDFEEEDLCGWTQDLNHDFDWKRENYNTPSGSIGTGPSWDHTKGEGSDGYYMYIESSSRNENDVARLISPIYDKPAGEICFRFFYHMFGSTTGTLRVYLKKVTQSWDLNPSQTIFTLSGNQGDKWYRSFHALGHVDQDFQIIIEGVRGPGYISDIAIDDVSIIEDCTGDEVYTTTEVAYEAGTKILPVVDSCMNRCGQTESITNDTSHITCDCNDDCYDNNRCCPDFFDYCISETTTDMSNDIEQDFTTKDHHQDGITAKAFTSTQQETTSRLTQPSTISTMFARKIAATTQNTPTTTRRTPSTAGNTPPTTRKTPPTTVKIPPTTRMTTPTTGMTRNNRWNLPTRVPIVFKLPPTTRRIAMRIPSLTSTTTTSRPIYRKTVKAGKEIENDVIEMPIPKDSDKVLFVTSPLPEDYIAKEYWSDEDLSYEKPYMRHINESAPLFSIKHVEVGNYNILLIVIATTGIIVLTSAIAFAVIRRYGNPRNRIRFGSSNGTSQSDVRFLTHDEMIDFSLPKEYDTL